MVYLNKADKKYVILKRVNFMCLILALIFLLISTCTHYIGNYIVNKQIYENIILKPNSKAFEYWKSPPASIIRNYYIFEVLNPKEILRGRRPQLREHGPYAYREKISRRNIQFKNENRELSFTPVNTLSFVPELSNGTENDTFMILNVPLTGLLESMKDASPLAQQSMNLMLKALKINDLFVRKSVREFMGGYNDSLLKIGKQFQPDLVKTETFSILNGKNNTEYQQFVIRTGVDGINDVGRVLEWNNKTQLDKWYSNEANMINGTDGTIYSPYLEKTQKRYSFNSDLCRSFHLEYLRDNVYEGVKVYDYHIASDIFDELYTRGFCDDEKKCLPNGILNVSQCYDGNGYISQPHFLNADEFYLNSVKGLKPSQEKHDMILKFEPLTGVAITGSIRFQINFILRNSKNFDVIKQIPQQLIFPVMWFDDEFILNESLIQDLGDVGFYMRLLRTIVHYTLITGVCTSLISMLSFILLFICNKHKSQIKVKDHEKTSKEKLMGVKNENF